MKIITYNLKLNNIKLSEKFILVFLLLFSIIIPTNRSIAQPNYILEGAPYFDEYGIPTYRGYFTPVIIGGKQFYHCSPFWGYMFPNCSDSIKNHGPNPIYTTFSTQNKEQFLVENEHLLHNKNCHCNAVTYYTKEYNKTEKVLDAIGIKKMDRNEYYDKIYYFSDPFSLFLNSSYYDSTYLKAKRENGDWVKNNDNNLFLPAVSIPKTFLRYNEGNSFTLGPFISPQKSFNYEKKYNGIDIGKKIGDEIIVKISENTFKNKIDEIKYTINLIIQDTVRYNFPVPTPSPILNDAGFPYQYLAKTYIEVKKYTNGLYSETFNYKKDEGSFILTDAVKTPDNSIIIIGTQNSSFCCFKIDKNGSILWQKNIKSGNNSIDRLTCYKLLKNGDIILGGNQNGPYNNNSKNDNSYLKVTDIIHSNFFVCRVSSNGILLWKKTYPAEAEDRLFQILTNDENRIYLVGTSNSHDTYKAPLGYPTKIIFQGSFGGCNYNGRPTNMLLSLSIDNNGNKIDYQIINRNPNNKQGHFDYNVFAYGYVSLLENETFLYKYKYLYISSFYQESARSGVVKEFVKIDNCTGNQPAYIVKNLPKIKNVIPAKKVKTTPNSIPIQQTPIKKKYPVK